MNRSVERRSEDAMAFVELEGRGPKGATHSQGTFRETFGDLAGSRDPGRRDPGSHELVAERILGKGVGGGG